MWKIVRDLYISLIDHPASRCGQPLYQFCVAISSSIIFVAWRKRTSSQRNSEQTIRASVPFLHLRTEIIPHQHPRSSRSHRTD